MNASALLDNFNDSSLAFSSQATFSMSNSSHYPYTSKTHLSNSIEFSFSNEVGTGTGPTLEFYNLLTEKLLEKTSLFTINEKSQLVSFTVPPKFHSVKLCSEIEKYCLFLGRIMARSLIDNRQIPVKFSGLAWKQILAAAEIARNPDSDKEYYFDYCLQDLVDQETFNSLSQIAKSIFDESFSVQGCSMGRCAKGLW